MLKNLSIFASWRTQVVTLVLEPIFTVMFYRQLNPNSNQTQMVVSAIILTMLTQFITVYAQVFVKAQVNGILLDIFGHWSTFWRFQWRAVTVAALVAGGQGLVIGGLYGAIQKTFLVSGWQVLEIVVVSLVVSSVVTPVFVIQSLGRANPYFGTNLLVGILPFISATLLPISVYPQWLATLSYLSPYWLIQNIVWTGQVSWPLVILYSASYGLVGALICQRKRRQLLQN
ncbi:hypothetical protein [Fructobacillus ficulneus]|uniref:Uncharacterized protein n=1 Tax=Fructobacillus ficulneus TaxID=157463 RepID=A0A0K8MJM7_9LACO|nr:hypothetical protein [Fructobacillus ficulneus]GAP00070.1 hypothetical protein FFIC_280750 [Fructobacillus ficulneus]